MFRITAETCRAFTLAEILIMAAINNLKSTRSGPNPEQFRLSEPAIQGEYL
jgi:hypothetical protein